MTDPSGATRLVAESHESCEAAIDYPEAALLLEWDDPNVRAENHRIRQGRTFDLRRRVPPSARTRLLQVNATWMPARRPSDGSLEWLRVSADGVDWSDEMATHGVDASLVKRLLGLSPLQQDQALEFMKGVTPAHPGVAGGDLRRYFVAIDKQSAKETKAATGEARLRIDANEW